MDEVDGHVVRQSTDELGVGAGLVVPDSRFEALAGDHALPDAHRCRENEYQTNNGGYTE